MKAKQVLTIRRITIGAGGEIMRDLGAMECPDCGSGDLAELDNLHCVWQCNTCGYSGDGADFDTAPGDSGHVRA